jgi:cell division septation protein DedD
VLVSIATEGVVHRVRAGPYPSREAAARAAQAWREAAGLNPLMLPAAER